MALRFALAHPDYLDGPVLIDAPAGPTTETERRNYSGLIERLDSTPIPPKTSHAESPNELRANERRRSEPT